MKLSVEICNVNINDIHPSKSTKYSPNLYAWLTHPRHSHRTKTSHVHNDENGDFFIGLWDGSYLIGSRLIAVLCKGRAEQSWAFGHLKGLVMVDDFWSRYAATGRCAIDQRHQMHFLNDDTRWQVDGDLRRCLWCGNHSQIKKRWHEHVERSAWESLAKP